VFFSEHSVHRLYSLLRGSTVGYPSDSLASCHSTKHNYVAVHPSRASLITIGLS